MAAMQGKEVCAIANFMLLQNLRQILIHNLLQPACAFYCSSQIEND